MGYSGVVFCSNKFNYSSPYDELMMGWYISEWRGLVSFRGVFLSLKSPTVFLFFFVLFFSLRNSIAFYAVSGENIVQILQRMRNMNVEDCRHKNSCPLLKRYVAIELKEDKNCKEVFHLAHAP